MKKPLHTLSTLLLLMAWGHTIAQTPIVDLGIFKKNNDRKKLEVRLRPAEKVVNGVYSAGIFTVKVPAFYGVVLDVVPNTSQYGYTFAGPVGQADGFHYYRFQFSGNINTVNWEKEVEYPVITLQVIGTPPSKAYYELTTNDPWTRQHNGDYYQELNGQELQRTFYKLPFKLHSFYATGLPSRSVLLDWEFDSDAELDFSEVEYSTDGRNFGQVGSVPAHAVTDRAATTYNFVHNTPQANINYYRIKMVDINGSEEYSAVRSVNFDDLNADFSVFPNPTTGPVTLISRNLAKYGSGVEYQVVDNSGKVLAFNNVKDDNQVIDLTRFSAGAYYLKVMSKDEQLAKFQIVVAQ